MSQQTPKCEDDAWKTVGSPSRRGSAINAMLDMTHMEHNEQQNMDPLNSSSNNGMRRGSWITMSATGTATTTPTADMSSNWGSFGGFQWDGSSILQQSQQEDISVPPTQPISDTNNAPTYQYNDILSVPMLPNVSLEPIYRQHRSLSFSMGQDPTFFGYDDYYDETQSQQNQQPPQQPQQPPISTNRYSTNTFKSSLATTMEEEENDPTDFEFDLSYIRSRSKSSGAAFGLLSSAQHNRLVNLRRGSEQQDDLLINQRRRSSSRFFNGFGDDVPQQQPSDLLQRRLSQQSQLFQDYSFPDMRRQSLTLNTPAPTNIQQLADQLENTHLRNEFNSTANPPPLTPPAQPTFSAPPPLAPYQRSLPYQPSPAPYQQQQQSQYRPDLYSQHLQQPPFFGNKANLPLHQLPMLHPQQQQQQQQNLFHSNPIAGDYFDSDTKGMQDLGKGTSIHKLGPRTTLYMVEFKGGRTDFFYVPDQQQPQQPQSSTMTNNRPHKQPFQPQIGDLVIVEGDRGKDLGKVAYTTLSIDQVIQLEQKKQAQLQQLDVDNNNNSSNNNNQQQQQQQKRDIHIKRIFRIATPDEVNLLLVKGQDEHKALVVCQQKTKQRKLPMEVVDAEYQWDRRKLTFYFEAENRIDFRELVRELFKIYKTRIWMCVVTSPITVDDIHALSNNDTTVLDDISSNSNDNNRNKDQQQAIEAQNSKKNGTKDNTASSVHTEENDAQ
ncbi:PSP1 C-terminal conserved region-domain-containing protein [Mycotypha africana]|uniref:PSP1 C-terminal conserved region-domain-containing protein n=1 Tax=Mycotypha africana TaxID=64632 RepID=UPI002300135C|nr:PSP1 C-terminal conserved region-domain-containing protein [Mycotypha africana]KAI8987243.1 PSP1 C-terminal conserved region-domain-containing protein [Mycotypha africana]